MSLQTKNAAATAVTYSPYRLEGNRAIYIGAAHTDLKKDQIVLQSTSPKQVASSYGNRRSSANVINTVDVSIPSSEAKVARDMKLEASASIPVGATLAEFTELAARLSGLLTDAQFVEDMFLKGKIDF